MTKAIFNSPMAISLSRSDAADLAARIDHMMEEESKYENLLYHTNSILYEGTHNLFELGAGILTSQAEHTREIECR